VAGIKLIDKTDGVTIPYIINRLLHPEIHQWLFDDYCGLVEIAIIFFDVRTIVYGIFSQGNPEPIGVIWFTGVIPYRDCTLNIALFKQDDRDQGIITEPRGDKPSIAEMIKNDMVVRFHIHSVSANCIEGNEISKYCLEKFGFKKIGVKEKCIFADGVYKDIELYYLLLEEA
jgi:hypothetical protein